MIEPNGKQYKLTEKLKYKDTEVPEGFSTDGISYKFRFFGIFINRFDPRFIKAVIVHDYLTDNNDWEKANQYFQELLPKHWISSIMVKAVKIYRNIKGY